MFVFAGVMEEVGAEEVAGEGGGGLARGFGLGFGLTTGRAAGESRIVMISVVEDEEEAEGRGGRDGVGGRFTRRGGGDQ